MQPGVTYKWEGIKFRGDAVGGAYAISRERDVPSWVRHSPLRSSQTGGRQQSPAFFNVENAAPGGSGPVRARSVSPLRFWQTVQHGPGGGSGTLYDAAHAPQLSPAVGHYHAQSPYEQHLNSASPQQTTYYPQQAPQQLQRQNQPSQYQPQYNYCQEAQQRGNVGQNQGYSNTNVPGGNYPSYGRGPVQYQAQQQPHPQQLYQQSSGPQGYPNYYVEQGQNSKPPQQWTSPQYQPSGVPYQQPGPYQHQNAGQSYAHTSPQRQLGSAEGHPVNWNEYGGSDNQRGFLSINTPPTTQYNYKSNLSIGTLSEYAHPPPTRRALSQERRASPFGKKSPEWSTSQHYEVDQDKEAEDILNQPYRTRPIVKPGIKPAIDRVEGSYLSGGMARVGVSHGRGETPQEKFAEFQTSHHKEFSPFRDARGNIIIAGPNPSFPGPQNLQTIPQGNFNASQQMSNAQQAQRQMSPNKPDPSVDYSRANVQHNVPTTPGGYGTVYQQTQNITPRQQNINPIQQSLQSPQTNLSNQSPNFAQASSPTISYQKNSQSLNQNDTIPFQGGTPAIHARKSHESYDASHKPDPNRHSLPFLEQIKSFGSPDKVLGSLSANVNRKNGPGQMLKSRGADEPRALTVTAQVKARTLSSNVPSTPEQPRQETPPLNNQTVEKHEQSVNEINGKNTVLKDEIEMAPLIPVGKVLGTIQSPNDVVKEVVKSQYNSPPTLNSPENIFESSVLQTQSAVITDL